MISFDFSNLLQANIGEKFGLSPNFPDMWNEISRKGYLKVEKGRGGYPYHFMELPYDDHEDVKKWGDLPGKYKNFVVVGIGGSALGAYALFNALKHQYHNLISDQKVFFIDNSDPATILNVFDVVDLKNTVFNIITKSGSTAETMSAFSMIFNLLNEEGLPLHEHLIVTTDREKGDLIKIAGEYHLPTMFIPEGVGGRYSIFTPVGLLPALFMGIDLDALLEGAKDIDSYWRRTLVEENPVALSALANYLYHTQYGRNILALMCYKDALKGLGLWYQQLWAESLGKKYDLDSNTVETGMTPVVLRGATDQHSLLQLFMEGPNDKLFVFFEVKNPDRDSSFHVGELEKFKSLAYFEGKSSHDLITAELAGVKYALAFNGKPSYTISLDSLDAYHLGGLIYALQLQTVFSSTLYNINPFDQPGVEEGKKATYAIMGREGYDEKRKEMEDNIKEVFIREIPSKK
jgi:glucose-6-phosphate isomerase